jgi:hypothetical protein
MDAAANSRAPGRTTTNHPLPGVSQVVNLLYRRLAVGRLHFLLAVFPLLFALATQAAPLTWQPVPAGRMASLAVPATGKTGFSAMPAHETGLHFTNTLDVRLIMENNNFMQGAGVALGDFDGDGWCDIYFCAIDGTNALYRNLGNWKFEDVTALAGVGCPRWHSTGATFADIDGDGRLDLIVNTLGQGTHSFLNLGDGRFRESTEEAGLKSRTGATGLALADIDGDGALDLYVANYGTLAILKAGGRADMRQVNGQWQILGPYADRLRYVNGRLEEVGEPDVLYRNDGHGHFTPVPWNSEWFLDEQGKPMPPPWDFGLTVQMRDIDEDGYPDIYVCNDFQTVDRLWLNDGKGHFRLAPRMTMRQQSFASMGVDFADIDRDGHLDFFVVEMLSRDHPRRMRQIGAMQHFFPVPGYFENRPEVARNTLFRNRGDGTYAEIANFAGVEASEWSWQPVFLDVDLDGFEDILVVNGHAFDVQDRDALQKVRSLGAQTPAQKRTNILIYPKLETPNMAFRNRRDLTFEETGHAWGFDSLQVSHGIALADLDHDGDLDVVVNCLNAPPLLYRNDSVAPRVAVRLRGAPPNTQGIGAKIKLLDGAVPMQSQEIVCGGRYLAGDDPIRVFAAGTATNRMRLEVTWRSGRRSLLDDVRANCLYEVDEAAAQPAGAREPGTNAVAKPQPIFSDVSSLLNHTHHEEQFNDYSQQPLLTKQLSQLGPGVCWFDLDGDGHDDLIVGSGRGGELSVFRGDGHGGFSLLKASQPAPLSDDLCGLAGFVNSATGARVLLGALASYESQPRNTRGTNAAPAVWSWQLDPDRTLVSSPLPKTAALPGSAGPLAIADFDGDGDLDVFVGGRFLPGAYPHPTSSRLFRQQEGQLVLDETNRALLENVGLVSGALWSDLDGDGFPELVLACEWGPLKILKNNHGKLAPWNPPVQFHGGGDLSNATTLDELTGWWSGITAVDLDGDGRLDLVAGNWGLNSPFHASLSQPTRLYYGDIGGRGVMDLVEAEYAPEVRAIVPRRALSALAQAAPLLAQFFPTHAAFSTASVDDLFHRLNVHPAEVRAATLASMLFLNRGDHFEAMPLPSEAQWSPVFAVTAADFDGDGHEDIFLSQNFFALRPEIPRLDAGRGLLLHGLGNGMLVPVPGQSSGVLVYGEQRGAAVSDFNEDGRPDLVVTQNGAATRLFENTTGAPGLRVRLRGPPGNPQGVGAVVRLNFESHAGPAREVHAGSGYWSQDSSVLVLATPSSPREISARWPGGATTKAAVPPGAHEITFDHKAAVTVIR